MRDVSYTGDWQTGRWCGDHLGLNTSKWNCRHFVEIIVFSCVLLSISDGPSGANFVEVRVFTSQGLINSYVEHFLKVYLIGLWYLIKRRYIIFCMHDSNGTGSPNSFYTSRCSGVDFRRISASWWTPPLNTYRQHLMNILHNHQSRLSAYSWGMLI